MLDRRALAARMRERRFPWSVFGRLVVVSAISLVMVAVSVAHRQAADPPECLGMGRGCDAGPVEVALLMAVFVYVPGLALLAAVLGAAELFGPRLQLVRSAVALAAAALAVGLALVWGVSALA